MDETAVNQRVCTASVMVQEVVHDMRLTFDLLAVGTWDVGVLTERTELDLEKRNVHVFILLYRHVFAPARCCNPLRGLYTGSILYIMPVNDPLNVNNLQLKILNIDIFKRDERTDFMPQAATNICFLLQEDTHVVLLW